MNLPTIIACGGSATVGKDLFCDLLIDELRNDKITKLSFATLLKADCHDFLKQYCQIEDPFFPPNKSEIRPFWVWYGEYKRKQTNGRYFVDSLSLKIKTLLSTGAYKYFLIPDLRYKEFKYDEIDFIREYDSVFVFLDKYSTKDGHTTYTGPANKSEAVNIPILRQICDYRITWMDCDGSKEKIDKFCRWEVQKFISWLNHRNDKDDGSGDEI